MGIQGMVTRKGWDGTVWGANQHLSVSEAIAVNTCHGAWASGEEAIKGSIAAGKLADYVVLADDPHAVDVEKIKDSEIVRTVVGGKICTRPSYGRIAATTSSGALGSGSGRRIKPFERDSGLSLRPQTARFSFSASCAQRNILLVIHRAILFVRLGQAVAVHGVRE